MDSYNHINTKRPLILRVRELEEELLEVNGTLSSWIIHYCDKVGIPIPDREGLYYLVKRTNAILYELKEIYQPKVNTNNITDKETEPGLRCCQVGGT